MVPDQKIRDISSDILTLNISPYQILKVRRAIVQLYSQAHAYERVTHKSVIKVNYYMITFTIYFVLWRGWGV